VILGIDASNLRAGGGITHLLHLLRVAEPQQHGIDRVIVWGGRNPLEVLPQQDWLDLREEGELNRPLPKRLWWQQTKLGNLAREECDLLFVPGGLYLGDFRPYVTMFQNMQIFETSELNRERFFGKEWLRLRLLHVAQSQTFRKASGLICLSEYSRNHLIQYYADLLDGVPMQLIPHGTAVLPSDSSVEVRAEILGHKNFKILCVSTIKKYKHQWNLIDAVGLLRNERIPLELHLVGGGDPQALRWMREAIQRNHSDHEFIFYHGSLPYKETLEWYRNKIDIFVFSSTCENLPVILLEAMTAGLSIASSDRGPMPEVLKDAGRYFNPESVTSIKNCLRYLIDNPDLCQRLSAKAKQYSQTYSWKKCAEETLAFFRSVYEGSKA
jgi:glycosyltransferase involved in cell wall biosynthesis